MEIKWVGRFRISLAQGAAAQGQEGEDGGLHTSNQLVFNDATNGWGLDGDGQLYKTKDGGATWERIASNVSFAVLTFLMPNTCEKFRRRACS